MFKGHGVPSLATNLAMTPLCEYTSIDVGSDGTEIKLCAIWGCYAAL